MKRYLNNLDQINNGVFVKENATVFAQSIQSLNDKNFSFVMWDAKDNDRKALTIQSE